MFTALKKGFKALEHGKVGRFGNDVSTPYTRRLATLHFHLFDHAFLRGLWTNLDEIAPGVWRSNQPSPRRIERYAALGIKTVVSLRGEPNLSFDMLERDACARHGITYVATRLTARAALPAADYIALLDLFATLEKPFLFHCKSGADRAGIAAALYLLQFEGVPLSQARKQLSLRYMHLRSTKTGILDHILDLYGRDMEQYGAMSVREWFQNHYDAQEATRTFKRYRRFP